MRVWVTRPLRQAEATSQLLREQGVAVWCQPVMEICPLPELGPEQRNQVMNVDLYSIAIFISQNAVHYGCALIDQFWPQVPVGLNFFAVGKATARALSNQGLLAQAPVSVLDSEGLLALPALQQVAQQRVIIFKGQGGRNTLAKTLAERGARVDNCELYSRQHCQKAVPALQASDFGLQGSDRILAYSGASVELIHKTLQAAGRTEVLLRPVVVPGERVANIAQRLGFERVVTAQNATDQAMLAALFAAEQH